jgi:hypothetical protein
MIPSSYSSPSSGCSSYFAALSGSAAISGISMGSGSGCAALSGSGSGAGAGAPLGMWDKLWFHWMRPKYGLSVISPSSNVPLIPFFLRM